MATTRKRGKSSRAVAALVLVAASVTAQGAAPVELHCESDDARYTFTVELHENTLVFAEGNAGTLGPIKPLPLTKVWKSAYIASDARGEEAQHVTTSFRVSRRSLRFNFHQRAFEKDFTYSGQCHTGEARI